MQIEPLNKKHERESFDCGDEALNNFLKRTARQHIERNLSRTFVLTDGDPKVIISYATLTTCDVDPAHVPLRWAGKYPHPIPAIRLARLATDLQYAGRNYGTHLLIDMMNRVADGSLTIGFVGLFVDAKTQRAADWYERFGFIPVDGHSLTLFMPLKTIREAFEAE